MNQRQHGRRVPSGARCCTLWYNVLCNLVFLPALANPIAPAARRRSDRPAARGPQQLLGTGEFIPFVPDGQRHFLEDSTELVQKALDALAKTGGTLYLPPALYTVRKTLVLRGARGAHRRGRKPRRRLGAWAGPGARHGARLGWTRRGADASCRGLRGHGAGGLHFTTAGAPGQEGGAATVDTMIAIGSGQRLWLEDLGAGWLAGDGGAQGAGVCSTFLRIGAGAAQVTLRAAQLKILMLRAGRILRANWSVVQQLAGVLSKTKRRLEGAPLQEILAGVSW